MAEPIENAGKHSAQELLRQQRAAEKQAQEKPR
jgi:hypothetical protein